MKVALIYPHPGKNDWFADHRGLQRPEKTQQPTLPGPLADDFATWAPA